MDSFIHSPYTAILQFLSYSVTNWPTVKFLHDLQEFFSNPLMSFKAG